MVVLVSLYQIARNHASNYVRTQGKIETNLHIDKAVQKSKILLESLEIQKEVENHMIYRDTYILKGEKRIKDFAEKTVNW
jgi:hypothetical protein